MSQQVIVPLVFNTSLMRTVSISISFCGDSEPIDAFINTYGKSMYIDFMRHWIQKAEDAQVPQEELYYTVDFGYTADAKKNDNRYQHRTG